MGGVEPVVSLARLGNCCRCLPRDAPVLRRRLVTALRTPANVRVSLWWVEAAVFAKVEPVEVAEALAKAMGCRGELLGARLGEPEPPPGLPLAAAYRMLLMENRFWEAHVVGEAMWRRIGLLGRALAVIAGAFARAQEGAPRPGEAMVWKAYRWLEGLGLHGLVDAASLSGEVWRVYESGWGWPLPLLEPLVSRAEELLDAAKERSVDEHGFRDP